MNSRIAFSMTEEQLAVRTKVPVYEEKFAAAALGRAPAIPTTVGNLLLQQVFAIVSRRVSSFAKHERMERTIPVIQVSPGPSQLPQVRN
jgi:hypothetical protein